MAGVYKVAYAKQHVVEKLYVFIGSRLIDKEDIDIQTLFNLEPNNALFDGVFDESEIDAIAKDNTEVLFVNAEIHSDDTIETVKKKIIISAPELEIAYAGLYLFCKGEQELDAPGVYQMLTQDGRLELSKERLFDFLLNIQDASIDQLPEKDVYDYDDILALDLPSISPRLIAKPIGQRFIAASHTFPYTVNPFDVVTYDSVLEKFSSDMLATTNQNLLMETTPINKNTLFICLAKDVFEFAKANALNQETTARVYYPYLAEENVTSFEKYMEVKPKLEAETGEMVRDEVWNKNVERVNLFYDIAENMTSSSLITEQGVKSVSFEIRPEYTYNLPLDLVFKLIHTEQDRPLIKYNPGKRQEKIYRLYADNVATNGKKIPYLSKGTIFKTMKTIGKSRQVSVYIEVPGEAGSTTIVLDFESDGNISIDASFPNALPIVELNEQIIKHCNPVILIVKEFLQQRGYIIGEFKGIFDHSISINNMEYIVRAPLKKKMAIKPFIGCISSVFNVVSDDVNKGVVMRYKRVANYNLMDSQEAFIVEKLNQGASDVEVIGGLMDNFGIKKLEEAREKLAEFLSRQQIVQAAFKGRRVKIKSNPGFETIIMKEPLTSNLVIIVKGIDGIGYLETLPKYISAFLVMTQDLTETSVPESTIKKLCKGKEAKEEKKKEDLVAPVEEPENEIKKLVFGKDAEIEEPDKNMQNALLNMLIDDDSDEEDSDEEDQGGGANGDEPLRDITGMNLHPNPIHERLDSRQPMLFLKEDKPGMKAYSRTCASNLRKQPVILTQEEKDKIDRDHPGSYTKSLAYKAGPDQPTYHYICPRYWSLRDNVSLTEEQVASGKYGKIIPKGAKTVREGETIYEMDGTYHRNQAGERISLVPGFYSKKIPGTNLCVPCCYKDWDKPDQVRLRNECLPGEEDKRDDKPVRKAKKRKLNIAAKIDEYIKGPEKFPLEPDRLGYLPIAIQKFLHTDNKTCQVSQFDTNIKKNTPCLVRMGIEFHEKQSFIAGIAALAADPGKRELPKSIEDMKQTFLDTLNLDKFTRLQNGNLVDIFDSGENVDVTKYTDSALYKSLERSNPEELALLKKAVRSFENYKRFIESSDVIIDYQYTWDLVTMPNESVFPQGINLVILEVRKDDITDNVHVICPSNHYSSTFFDVNKKVCILIKRGNLYEPIITYEDKDSKYIITKLFSLKYKGILPNLKSVLDTIKTSMNDKCLPLPSQPRVYKFSRNVGLDRVEHVMRVKKYKINTQVINYNGQVIGVVVKKGDIEGYVPCFPSAPDPELSNYKWMDAYQGQDYLSTKAFLSQISKDSKGEIKVLPSVKVIDDGLIVGILTQADQFVPIFPPTQDTFGEDLEVISDMDYVAVNKQSLTDDSLDEERIAYVRKIHLESSFFDTFRSTVRMLLGKYSNQKTRREIEEIVRDESMTYFTKLTTVENKIRDLVGDKVGFSDYSPEALSAIIDVSTCASEKEKCSDKPFCITSETGCKLLVPARNLITDVSNEDMYFGRVADEIVRYSRIRSFIFEPKAFLSFSTVKYNLRENEVILLQSLLNQEYFDDLVPRQENRFVKYETYDTVEPFNSQVYSDNVRLQKEADIDVACEKPKLGKVAGKWEKTFPEGKELIFPDAPPKCTFEIMQTIIEVNNSGNATHTLNELKEMLADEYTGLYEKYPQGIIDTWKAEGKTLIAKQVELGQVVISDIVISEDYYATLLDFWILCTRFNIPVVFYSATTLPENKQPFMVGNRDVSDSYFFIKIPGSRSGGLPKFRLLVMPDGAKVSTDDISLELNIKIKQESKENMLESFLSSFKLKQVREKVKKPLKLVEKLPSKAKKQKKRLVLKE
jgi:hypothetical protein